MRFGVAQKVNLLTVSIILFFGTIMGTYFINDQTRVFTSELDEKVNILLSNLAFNLEYPVLISDHESIARLLEGGLAQQDVVFGRITDKNGDLLLQKGAKAEGPTKEFTANIVTKKLAEGSGEDLILGIQEEAEEVIGKVSLQISLLNLYRKINRVKYTVVFIVITVIALTSLASYLLLKFILGRPIQWLLSGTKRIASGDLRYQVPVKTEDEIGELAQSFNKMTEDLSRTTVSKNYVDNILKNMVDTLIVVNPDTTIRSVNKATCDLLGYQENELIGKPISVIFGADEESVFKDSKLDDSRKKGLIQNLEVTYLTKEGKEIPMLLSGSSMYGDNNKILGEVYVALDISERKRMEEKILQKSRALERSNEELEQFAYVASHDLQEPLRMVASYLQLITKRYKGKLDTDADEFINYAMDGAGRMRKMINDLLQYSRVSTRGGIFELTECEEILKQSLANLEMAIKDANAVVTHDPLPRIKVDGGQMVQLFQNLIGNAVKFSNESSPEVHISANNKGVEWIFSVRDNGIGIEPQYLERIFQIFQRLHGTREYSGTGIGLAVCRRIVERHGGRIWVESEPGKGATFYFTIPIERKDNHEQNN